MTGTDAVDSAETLRRLGERTRALRIDQLMHADPARARDFALRVGPLYANFSRQRYDREALASLFSMFEALEAPTRLKALFDGEPVNCTESRAALHTALRSGLSDAPAARNAHKAAMEAQSRMAGVIERLRARGVTDVVSVGIGGSDLGARLVVDAFGHGDVRVHFLSNVDGHAAQRVIEGLEPSNTAVLLISKSFGTQETLLNGALLRDWLGDDSRLYAITANGARAADAFGIPAERVLPMWDWVGGRYSLWSAVGLPISIALGMDSFRELLAGAARMDEHVLHAPLDRNLAVWHAATAVFNRNALGLCTHAVLPYDERLRLLPAYLQQLVMESLGKSVRADGSAVDLDTVPVWWGGAGTDVQHSFFQALHQGTSIASCDFIGVVKPDSPHAAHHAALLSNLFAQSEAFANGQSDEDPHRRYEGNRPGTVMLIDELTPQALGTLLALYEHSVYLQSLVWGINAFDQFGVELGKQIAATLLPAVRGEVPATDPVTRELVGAIRG